MSAGSDSVLRLGIVGAGAHALALAQIHPHGAVFASGRVSVTCWSPDPFDCSAASIAGVAARVGARAVASVDELVADPLVDALLLDTQPAHCLAVFDAARDAGKPVLCPVPVPGVQDWTRWLAGQRDLRSCAGLIEVRSTLGCTPAGEGALRLHGEGALGDLRSVYIGVRTTGRGQHDPFAGELLPPEAWDALDFVLEAIASPVRRVFAIASSLFGVSGTHGVPPDAAPDTLIAYLRFEGGLVLSLDASACLPRALTACELEIEMIGSRETLRLTPYDTRATVFLDVGEEIASRRYWLEPPIEALLENFVACVRDQRSADAPRARRLGAIAHALRASIASGEPVTVAS